MQTNPRQQYLMGGIAVYSRVEFIPSYPSAHNLNSVETMLMKMNLPHVTIIGI